MRSVANMTLIFFAVLFWIFRVAVVLCGTLEIEFPVTSFNSAVEIPILFITVVCLVLIIRRNFIGALVLFVIYAGFFGMEIANTIAVMNDIPLENEVLNVIELDEVEKVADNNISKSEIKENGILGIISGVFGIMIALINMIYIIVTSNKKTVKATKKTDWFYQNEQFDRELDERADKNNYRIN